MIEIGIYSFTRQNQIRRMWNADGTLNDANAGEVPMVDAIRNTSYPKTWPTDGRAGGVPDPAAAGPNMIQIGNESGFLPNAAELQNQPIDYEYGRRSITVLNVSSKNLLLAPAERADVVVDFSKYAGQTLILYNDAPAPVPAFDPRYDYYTGDPDQSATGENTGGAPTTQPGYGPNTRTIMQIKVAPATSTTTDTTQTTLDTLKTEIPKAFATGQNKLIAPDPNTYGTIQDTSLTFKPPGATSPITMPEEPKAIAEEFETNYGRMNATLGVEMPNTNFQNQTTIMLGYIDPATENLTDAATPLTPPTGDGTQIWKITHNGVDTHAIHFHLFDVQLINRVGWDGSIRFPDDNERGWKDTVRMNPLEDTIIALRPVAPKLPFALPDSIRLLDPTMPEGSTMGFMGVDPKTGNPMTVTNMLTNFGWEYVWHCHLLGHEENDMMRPIVFTVAQKAPVASTLTGTRNNGGPVDLSWTDPTPINYSDLTTFGNPSNEIGYKIQRAPITNGKVGTYSTIGTALANATTYTDSTANPYTDYSYQVIAYNVKGDTLSNAVKTLGVPIAPTNLTAVLSGTSQINLSWNDNSNNETGFIVERSTDGTNFTGIATIGANSTNYSDKNLTPGTYTYRVKAIKGSLSSNYSNIASLTIVSAPTNLQATLQNGPAVDLTWTDHANNETGFIVERSTNGGNYTAITTLNGNPNTGTVNFTDSTVKAGTSYNYRVKAISGNFSSSYSNTVQISTPVIPKAPTGLKANVTVGLTTDLVYLSWQKSSGTVTQYTVQYATNSTFTNNLASDTVTSTADFITGLTKNNTYYFRVKAMNQSGSSSWSQTISVRTP